MNPTFWVCPKGNWHRRRKVRSVQIQGGITLATTYVVVLYWEDGATVSWPDLTRAEAERLRSEITTELCTE